MHDIQIHCAEKLQYDHRKGGNCWPIIKRIINIQRELSDDQLKRIVNIILEEKEDETEQCGRTIDKTVL
jgi:hypothetical protein